MPDPLVSVWIPSYNHGRWLGETIESALEQTYGNVEVVIVDDASADDSSAVAEGYARDHPDRVRFLTHAGRRHRGLSETANLAVRSTRGAYLAGVPSDDILALDMVERQVAVLEANPATHFAYGYARAVDASGAPVPRHPIMGEDINRHSRPVRRLFRSNPVPGLTVMVRRESMFRLAPRLYHESVVYCDWDLWIRLAANGPVAFVPRVLGFYRVHGNNLTLERDQAVSRRRSLDVLTTIDADADDIGGELGHPTTRASLRLELALRCYRDGLFDDADRWAAASFAADPTLDGETTWLGQWLDDRLDPRSPPDDLPAWLLARASPAARASLARHAGAFNLEQEAHAAEVRGERLRAAGLALRSVWLRPGRIAQPHLLHLCARLLVGPRTTAAIRRLRSARSSTSARSRTA